MVERAQELPEPRDPVGVVRAQERGDLLLIGWLPRADGDHGAIRLIHDPRGRRARWHDCWIFHFSE
jgi:hypothetical protein